MRRKAQPDGDATGAKGLTIARDHTPDVVILDLMLPGIDGFEVLRRLRSVNANLPVLMLTARDETDDQMKGLEAGAFDKSWKRRVSRD